MLIFLIARFRTDVWSCWKNLKCYLVKTHFNVKNNDPPSERISTFNQQNYLGIEDWAPPLPQVCSRLTKFVIFFKRVVILEALISTLVINAREFKINNFELSEFYNILFENSPLDVKSDQQYSMGNLFDCIRERYHV